MGLSWIDVSLIALLIGLAAVLTAESRVYLNRRDTQQVLRNRQAMCKPHEWVKREPTPIRNY